MIVNYSQPYTPSGLRSPVEGDFVLVHWEAPLRRNGELANGRPWVIRRFAVLQSSIYADVVKFKGYRDLPKAHIVRVTAWNGTMPAGIKSW